MLSAIGMIRFVMIGVKGLNYIYSWCPSLSISMKWSFQLNYMPSMEKHYTCTEDSTWKCSWNMQTKKLKHRQSIKRKHSRISGVTGAKSKKKYKNFPDVFFGKGKRQRVTHQWRSRGRRPCTPASAEGRQTQTWWPCPEEAPAPGGWFGLSQGCRAAGHQIAWP